MFFMMRSFFFFSFLGAATLFRWRWLLSVGNSRDVTQERQTHHQTVWKKKHACLSSEESPQNKTQTKKKNSNKKNSNTPCVAVEALKNGRANDIAVAFSRQNSVKERPQIANYFADYFALRRNKAKVEREKKKERLEGTASNKFQGSTTP
jgi:hypothetical protein